MSIKRYSFLFSLFFFLLFVSFAHNFRRSAEAQLNHYIGLKNSNLPFVIITTDGLKAVNSKENYRRAEVLFCKDFAEAEMQIGDTRGLKCRIRGHGNSTWNTIYTNKRSYLLKLDEEKELFGMNAARKWVLQANVTDKTSLRNVYSYHIGAEIFDHAGWTAKTQFVHLVLNNKYLGLYGLMEKLEISPARLNLDDGSFLAEVNSRLNREWNFTSTKGVKFSIREKKGETIDYYRAAEKKLQDFENVLFSDSFKDEKTGYREFVDLESFVDWYLINEYTKNHDARFQDSCFLFYSSADKKLHMGPIWDFDIACGNAQHHGSGETEGLLIQSQHWFKRLWEDEFFRQKVAERWADCRDKVENSIEWILQSATELEYDANIDNTIWQRFGRMQWPNTKGYRQRKTYRAEVDYMTSWLKERIIWLDSAFASTE